MIICTESKGFFREKNKVGIGCFDLLIATNDRFEKLPEIPGSKCCAELSEGNLLISYRNAYGVKPPKFVFYRVVHLDDSGMSCKPYKELTLDTFKNTRLPKREHRVLDMLIARSKALGARTAIYLTSAA